MDNNSDKKLYTLLVYSENIAGILNQITAVFTRRQVNIESLNVSASSIKNIHKYTITVWSDPEQIEKINKAIEKKIDVVKSDYYSDDQIFIHEVALFKISTPVLLENPEVSRTIRKHDARMMEVNPTYSTVLLAGLTEDIADLFHKLNSFDCLLQYTRSGRIAVTRSFDEPISDYLKQCRGITEIEKYRDKRATIVRQLFYGCSSFVFMNAVSRRNSRSFLWHSQ